MEESERKSAETTANDGSDGAAGFAAGLILGLLIGGGIALLFAPTTGRKTRRRLGRRVRALRERAGGGFDAARAVREDLERRRRRLRARLDQLAVRARNRLDDLR